MHTEKVIFAAIQEINAVRTQGKDWYAKTPWAYFLAIKWALLTSRTNDLRPAPRRKQFERVIDLIRRAGSALFATANSAMQTRRIFSQQIWYQHKFESASLGRQMLLLVERYHDSTLLARFKAKYTCTPLEFLRESVSVMVASASLVGEPGFDDYVPEERNLSAADSVLGWYAADIPDLARMARRRAGTTSIVEEVCEHTSLKTTPLIRFSDGEAHVLHNVVLFRAVETTLFDRMRVLGASRFQTGFGKVFEQYVGEVLSLLPCRRIIAGTAVDQALNPSPVHKKFVDYIIEADDFLLLVEVKGSEAHYMSVNSTDEAVVAHYMRSDLLDGVAQFNSTMARLPDSLRKPNVFVWYVTYKQDYVGSGGRLRGVTGEALPVWIDAIASNVPLEHHAILSIEQLERTVRLIVDGHESLLGMLTHFSSRGSMLPATSYLQEKNITEIRMLPMVHDALARLLREDPR